MSNKVTLDEIHAKLNSGQIAEAAKLIQTGVSQRIDFQGEHLRCASILLYSAAWGEISALRRDA